MELDGQCVRALLLDFCPHASSTKSAENRLKKSYPDDIQMEKHAEKKSSVGFSGERSELGRFNRPPPLQQWRETEGMNSVY